MNYPVVISGIVQSEECAAENLLGGLSFEAKGELVRAPSDGDKLTIALNKFIIGLNVKDSYEDLDDQVIHVNLEPIKITDQEIGGEEGFSNSAHFHQTLVDKLFQLGFEIVDTYEDD